MVTQNCSCFRLSLVRVTHWGTLISVFFQIIAIICPRYTFVEETNILEAIRLSAFLNMFTTIYVLLTIFEMKTISTVQLMLHITDRNSERKTYA